MYFSSLERICMQISFCNISLLLETARLHPQLSFIFSCHLQQHRDADGQWKASGLKWKIPKELLQPETIRGGLLLECYLLLWCCSGSVDQVFSASLRTLVQSSLVRGFTDSPECNKSDHLPLNQKDKTFTSMHILTLKGWWVPNTPSENTKPLWFQPKKILCAS